jgi:hypothetical protein
MFRRSTMIRRRLFLETRIHGCILRSDSIDERTLMILVVALELRASRLEEREIEGHEQSLVVRSFGHEGRTWTNLTATSLKPRCSKRLMTSPTSPRWTPSCLTMMRLCSRVAAIMKFESVEYELDDLKTNAQTMSTSSISCREETQRREGMRRPRTMRRPYLYMQSQRSLCLPNRPRALTDRELFLGWFHLFSR